MAPLSSSSHPPTYSVDLPGAPVAGPSTFPGFVSPVEDNERGLERVIRAVLKAKKVSVVVGTSFSSRKWGGREVDDGRGSGAGVSTAAEIPDFRSAGGLFATLKDRFPSAKLSSGKDLFDVAAWKVRPSPSMAEDEAD